MDWGCCENYNNDDNRDKYQHTFIKCLLFPRHGEKLLSLITTVYTVSNPNR